MARIVVTVPVPVACPCPFVHAPKGARPRCETCHNLIAKSDLASFNDGGSPTSCSLGRHVPRICEWCADREAAADRAPAAATPNL